MSKIDEVTSILRHYMGFNCACEVADRINELYKNNWDKRKKLLKNNGWIYNKKEQMWDSSGGCAEWTNDLKLMSDEEFKNCLNK